MHDFAPQPRSHDEVDVNAGTGCTERFAPKRGLEETNDVFEVPLWGDLGGLN